MLKVVNALTFLLVGYTSQAQITTAAGSSFKDASCEVPLGAMVQACKDIADAFKSTCVKKYFDKFHEMARQGSLKDAGDFCDNSQAISNEVAFQNVNINFFGALVAKESSGKANAANTSSPNGTALGYMQLDAKSVQSYECCKGITDKQLVDGEQNAMCGIGMSLENMTKDNCWAMGGGGDSTSFGAAKFNQPLRAVAAHDKATKKEIMDVTKNACSSPSTTPMPGNGGSGAVSWLEPETPHYICLNF